MPMTMFILFVCIGCVLPFNNVASTLLLERDYFMVQPNSQCALAYDGVGACQNSTNKPNIYCDDGRWYQPPVAIGATVNCDDDKDNCYKDYCDGESAGEVQATTVMSIPYIISACLSPVLGGFVDKFGMRAVIATLAPAALVVVHALLGYSTVSPVGPLVGQGLAYSGFAAVLWPSIPLVVEPKYIGLGYGFVTAVQNIGLACFPLIIASIYMDSNEHYIPNVELFFVCLAVCGVLVGLYLNYYDLHHNNIFNAPTTLQLPDEGEYSSVQNPAIAEEEVTGEHKPTFTVHEELYRARVASGEIDPHGRTLSRGSRGSRNARTTDVTRLQQAYGEGGSKRQSSTEILVTSNIR